LPTTLELGGKGPVIVLPDADVDRAAKAIGYGIFGNAGQMCWAASRLLVHESLREPLVEKVRAIAEKLKLGPGVQEGVEMGPLVSREQADHVLEYVEDARSSGGKVLAGGDRPSDTALRAGNFVRPTVLTDVPVTSRAVREEIFGPVLCVASFKDVDEAVRLANDTPYGLLAALWTRDLGSAHSIARRLESGMVVVNEAPTSFPQTPFAGVKASGLGFEQGVRALDPFTRRKNVLVNLGSGKR
jgi:aldehyde dehydrogenase (NAD+)